MEFVLGVSLKFVREATKTGLRAKVNLLAQAADAPWRPSMQPGSSTTT